MKLIKWQIKDQLMLFPNTWTKEKLIMFLNTDIKVCPYCRKVDISNNHFGHCNSI